MPSKTPAEGESVSSKSSWAKNERQSCGSSTSEIFLKQIESLKAGYTDERSRAVLPILRVGKGAPLLFQIGSGSGQLSGALF